jgi:hypothetical protein
METVQSIHLPPDQKDGTCSICLDSLDTGELVSKTSCNHYFHPDCLRPWIISKNSCPLCREKSYFVIPVLPSTNTIPEDTGLYPYSFSLSQLSAPNGSSTWGRLTDLRMSDILVPDNSITLPFFFSQDSGLALPIAALPYPETRIDIAFRELEDLLQVD